MSIKHLYDLYYILKNIFSVFIQYSEDQCQNQNSLSTKEVLWQSHCMTNKAPTTSWKISTIQNAEDVRSNAITKHLKNLIQGVSPGAQLKKAFLSPQSLTTPRQRKPEPTH